MYLWSKSNIKTYVNMLKNGPLNTFGYDNYPEGESSGTKQIRQTRK